MYTLGNINLRSDWSSVIHSTDPFAPVVFLHPSTPESIQLVDQDDGGANITMKGEPNNFQLPCFANVNGLSYYCDDVGWTWLEDLDDFLKFLTDSCPRFENRGHSNAVSGMFPSDYFTVGLVSFFYRNVPSVISIAFPLLLVVLLCF